MKIRSVMGVGRANNNNNNQKTDITPVDARLESTEAQLAKDGVRYERYT